MQYLFRVWSRLEQKLSKAKYILLCVDFDGTLTPIKPRPKDARLGEEELLLLAKIARKKTLFAAIVSGRGLKDLQQKLAVKGLIFAANHGLEIADKNKHFIYPAAKRFIPLISQIGKSLSKRLEAFPEVTLEQKRLSLSLHYRLVAKERLPKLKAIFFPLIEPYLAKRKIKLTYGKKVWEVRPPLAWDKGRAVLWLVRRLKAEGLSTIYLGDDLTDEDGFRAVNKIRGLTIRVGREKSSQAKYYLRSTKDTQKFFRKILQLKLGSS